tara:strand:- start:2305 stop:2571 length:267 start_codon:yes stop_codon:yes gene_type:complete
MGNEQWHLSKSVPISFILAILAQTIALVGYVANLDNNVETNTRDIIRHEAKLQTVELTVQSQAVMSARMDENIQAIRVMLESMARDLK